MWCWVAQTGEKDILKDRTRADTVKELLAVIDSFEMAKGQLKPESEGEKRIDGSYQARCHRPVFSSRKCTVYFIWVRGKRCCSNGKKGMHTCMHALRGAS